VLFGLGRAMTTVMQSIPVPIVPVQGIPDICLADHAAHEGSTRRMISSRRDLLRASCSPNEKQCDPFML